MSWEAVSPNLVLPVVDIASAEAKIKPSLKIIIALPLILPPFLNISGYLAAIISLLILSFFSKEGLNSF